MEELLDIQKAATSIHAALCTESHDEACMYYQEEQLLGNEWEREVHIKWVEITKELTTKLGFSSAEEILTSMSKAQDSLKGRSYKDMVIMALMVLPQAIVLFEDSSPSKEE